jgi:DNA repair exonuclease SbcCD ATPase subunit
VKNVVFKNLKVENFLSIGDEPIEISFNKGITVITGENKDKGGKNGIGKSTIADSIFWCLFGNTIRELKKDKIQHNKNDKECKVILKFFVNDGTNITNYSITRILNPAKIEIINHSDQGDIDITLSTLPKNDEFIKNLIGANEEVFNNAVVMSANNTIPFMAQKKTEKRKFIEGILQLNVFSEMLLKTRTEYNDIKKENDILSNNFVNEQRILLTLNDNKLNFDESKSSRIDIILEKIKNISEQIYTLNKQNIPDVKTIKDNIKKLEDKKNELTEVLKDTNKKIVDTGKQYTDVYDKLRDAKNDKKKILDKGNICPTCNREYCVEDLNHVKSEIEKLDKIINDNQPIYDDLIKNKKENETFGGKIVDKINKIKEMIKDLNDDITKASLHDQKIKSLTEKITEYRESIREIETEIFKDDTKITDCENNIKKIEKDLKDIKKNMAVLDSVKFIVSEEGVKTYIVKKIIDILNTRLNYYLQALDAPCKCVFDEMFEEIIYNDQGKECSYFNFSGGERKRIDTAILFTFQDVMRCHSGTSFSLNIYDELFDSALDDKGVEKIIEILKEKVDSYDESIYIISHKNNTKTFIDNVIFLEKSNGVTKILS